MQSIMRIAMALVIAFGVETTASAQFGGLKGLAKKAKKAVEKVEKTVKSAVSRDLPRKRRKLSKRWRRPSRMSTTPRTT